MALISRTKTWTAEVLTHTDLNAEFDGIIDVLDGTASPQKNIKVAYDNADLAVVEAASTAASAVGFKATVSGAGAKGVVVNDGAADVGYIDTDGKVSGVSLESTVAIGTAPIAVTSTTVCPNLNADLLDGVEGSAYISGTTDQTITKDSANLTWEWASDTGVILKLHETASSYEYTIQQLADDLEITDGTTTQMTVDAANQQVEFNTNVEIQGNNSATIQVLTDQATVTMDCDSGSIGLLTLSGNRTLAALSNPKVGATYILVVKQSAGSNTLTWNSAFKFPSGTAPTLSTGAAAVDIFSIIVEDATTFYVTEALNFS